MARRVFFSYHFDRDNWRANQVRNSWVTKPDRQSAGFFDSAEQEEVKRASDEAIRRWIDEQLQNTTVTAVLIGAETSQREYVQYEIQKSFERGNALLGIRIHNLKDRDEATDFRGENPLDDFLIETESGAIRLTDIFPTYDWKRDNGKDNIGDWVEEAVEISEDVPDEWKSGLKMDEDEGGDLAREIVGAAVIGAGIWGAARLIKRYFQRRRYR